MMKAPAILFRPQTAVRVRWNTNTDTPLPPDEPAGENPPDGAMIDYYIGAGRSGPAAKEVVLEIKDESGQVVRRYSSSDALPVADPTLNIPPYWLRPPQKLGSEPGMHRFLWDMHYAPVPGLQPQYPIAAIYRNTAPEATSPWAMPGKYTVVLTVGGKSYDQPLTLAMDPRVKTSKEDLTEQFRLSKQVYDEWLALNSISESVKRIQSQISELQARVPAGDLKTHVNALNEKLQAFSSAPAAVPGAAPPARLNLATTSGRVRTLFNLMEDVDLAPTPQAAAAVPDVVKDSRALQDSWQVIKMQDITALNAELRAANLPAIDVSVTMR
jgi:hypothetical protein